jgi:hypothetical protein
MVSSELELDPRPEGAPPWLIICKRWMRRFEAARSGCHRRAGRHANQFFHHFPCPEIRALGVRQSVSYRLLCIGSGVRKASSPAAIMRYVLRFDTAFKPALRHHFLYRLLPHRQRTALSEQPGHRKDRCRRPKAGCGFASRRTVIRLHRSGAVRCHRKATLSPRWLSMTRRVVLPRRWCWPAG